MSLFRLLKVVLSQSLNVRGSLPQSVADLLDVMVGCLHLNLERDSKFYFGEFDPGSERTLAAWIRHASRTECLAVSSI